MEEQPDIQPLPSAFFVTDGEHTGMVKFSNDGSTIIASSKPIQKDGEGSKTNVVIYFNKIDENRQLCLLCGQEFNFGTKWTATCRLHLQRCYQMLCDWEELQKYSQK